MPFLRFTRDKRGYETTSLVHAVRGRHGKARQQVLYWFRTPPNVKVGRPALDPDAIRSIEENNPDIEFDWPRILAATPPPAPPTDEQRRDRRTRKQRAARPGTQDRRAGRRGPQPAPAIPRAAEVVADVEGEPDEPDTETTPDSISEMTPDPNLTPVERAVGREQLIRLRARYAEVIARIVHYGEQPDADPERPQKIEALRKAAEGLNPDNWVTEDEARKGAAEFEQTMHGLRAALGVKRRRRSRRGGRRRHRGPGGPGEPGGQTPPPAPASE